MTPTPTAKLPELDSLLHLIRHVNILIDENNLAVSLETAKSLIRKGDLFSWLDNGGWLAALAEEEQQAVIAGLRGALATWEGQERRKFGVDHNGLCLLIAWATYLIQCKEWS